MATPGDFDEADENGYGMSGLTAAACGAALLFIVGLGVMHRHTTQHPGAVPSQGAAPRAATNGADAIPVNGTTAARRGSAVSSPSMSKRGSSGSAVAGGVYISDQEMYAGWLRQQSAARRAELPVSDQEMYAKWLHVQAIQ